MKRGIKALFNWLLFAGEVNVVAMLLLVQRLVYLPTVISFPFAAWVYAGHSGRVSPVICLGLIAGAYAIQPAFTDRHGFTRALTPGWEFFIGGVPILMTLLCVGFFVLRRFLDREDPPCLNGSPITSNANR